MQRLLNSFLKMIVCTMLSMLSSVTVAMVNVGLLERSPDVFNETPTVWLFGLYPLPSIIVDFLDIMPVASLFGLLLLPSIIIYFVLDFFDRTRKARFIGYITPILALLVFFAIGYYRAVNSVHGEGADQIAVFTMECMVAGGIVVYFFLTILNRVKNQCPASLNTTSTNRSDSEGVQSE